MKSSDEAGLMTQKRIVLHISHSDFILKIELGIYDKVANSQVLAQFSLRSFSPGRVQAYSS